MPGFTDVNGYLVLVLDLLADVRTFAMRMLRNEEFTAGMVADADENRARIGSEPKAIYEDIVVFLEEGCDYAMFLSPMGNGAPAGEFEIHPIRHPAVDKVFGPGKDAEYSLVAYHFDDRALAAKMAYGLKEMFARMAAGLPPLRG